MNSPARDLFFDKFVADYIRAALWSSTDDDDKPLDDNYGPEDLAPETVLVMRADCADFLMRCSTNPNVMSDNFETYHPGHDFWLTRNRHGAGFWDGDYPVAGDWLTEVSQSFGEVNLYVGDDGKIHQPWEVT